MAYDLSNVRVLVVDDMQPMLALTKSLLNIFGFNNVQTVNNGYSAFEMLQDYDPDIVLTDWIMEPVDGLELTRMIRNEPGVPNPYVPIVMMTGFSSRMRVETARDSGVTEFLLKPFSSQDLCSRLTYIVEKPRQFVKTKNFFGPDRRRKHTDNFTNHKRAEDEDDTDNRYEIVTILEKLREEAKQK